MRGKDLLEKFNLVSLEYVKAADQQRKSKRKFFRNLSIGIAAACIIAIVHISQSNINVKIDIPVQTSTENAKMSASDKYHSLEELLEYLSKNEKHNDSLQGIKALSSIKSNIKDDSIDFGSQTVMYKDYLYHFNPSLSEDTGCIEVFSLKENKLLDEIEIDNFSAFGKLFIYQNNLILAKQTLNIDNYENTAVDIYSLSDPQKPTLQTEYIQNGNFNACYLSGNQLYVFSSDGVCACGFSPKSDTSQYYPSASMDGNHIQWSDDDITILGQPERVFYTAIGILDIDTRQLSQKRAIYGDIHDIFFDDNTMVCYVKSEKNDYAKPEVYLFELSENIPYTGKININTSGVTKILDIKKYGDTYRIIGQSYHGIATLWTSEIFAISADVKNVSYHIQKYRLSNAKSLIDDITWNGDNAIITIGDPPAIDLTDETAKFIFAVFDNDNISFKENNLSANRVTGIDGIEYSSSPFGNIQSMIPLENGLYLRYNAAPNGLDIYDFSDIDNPKCIYKSTGEIPTNCRFDLYHATYKDGILNIMVITSNSYGEFRNAKVTLNIYSVNPQNSQPFTLLNQYPITTTGQYHFGGLNGGFKIFEYNGQQFYVNPETHFIATLE